MADETTDASNREQIRIAARYLDNVNDNFAIRVDLICLLDVFEDMKERL